MSKAVNLEYQFRIELVNDFAIDLEFESILRNRFRIHNGCLGRCSCQAVRVETNLSC